MPGQQLIQPMGRMSGDASEDIGQPSLRINTVHLGGDDQAVHGGGASPAAIRPAEEPGFSSKSDAPQTSFGGVVG